MARQRTGANRSRRVAFDRLAQRNIRARGEQVREPPSLRGKIFYLQAIASSEWNRTARVSNFNMAVEIQRRNARELQRGKTGLDGDAVLRLGIAQSLPLNRFRPRLVSPAKVKIARNHTAES